MNLLRKKICVVTTVPYALNMFMKPHILMLAEKYDVTLITNGTNHDLDFLVGEYVHFIPISIARKISLFRDLYALIILCCIFRAERFDVVHSLTPKTGLLAMVAAFLARVPHRIHTFTGQVWANKVGTSRWVLKTFDKLIAICSTNLLTDSASQRQFLIDQTVAVKSKISVLGCGSVCGVDVKRFKPDADIRRAVRKSMNIPDDAIVYLFLGRLNKDKGILDLALAFCALADEVKKSHLLVVGPDESGIDVILGSLLEEYKDRFHRVGFTNVPEEYMACADIICVPSYREGFGSVIIEAGAVGIPAVASNIYGLMDAVVNGETGILHKTKDASEIKSVLLDLSNDSELRIRMGKAAQARARSNFDVNLLTEAMRSYYKSEIFGG